MTKYMLHNFTQWLSEQNTQALSVVPLSSFKYSEPNDEYLYHISPVSGKIIQTGEIRSGKPTMGQGFYRSYSKGKVFFTERSEVKWWADRIEEHLEHQYDNPPPLSVVRIPREWIESRLQKDNIEPAHVSYFAVGSIKL
ncbi:MAG: hypothetical protein M0R80_08185 [Proteobacteria bacterium]|jgi:hypothetical protein|nr:hypothetical protein [Pseudomonadota bacterium]